MGGNIVSLFLSVVGGLTRYIKIQPTTIYIIPSSNVAPVLMAAAISALVGSFTLKGTFCSLFSKV